MLPKQLALFQGHLKFLWLLGVNVFERGENFIWQGFFKSLVLILFVAVPFKSFRLLLQPEHLCTGNWFGESCLLIPNILWSLFCAASLKHVFTAVVCFQDSFERAVIFRFKAFALFHLFILSVLLKTYGVYIARALKQFFHVPCCSKLLIQTVSVSSIFCTLLCNGGLC